VEPETYVNVLKSNPESATASPRRIAELAFLYLLKDGPLVVAESNGGVAAAATKDAATRNCLGGLDETISAFVDPVTKLAPPEQGEIQFTEAKNKLSELLRRPSDSGAPYPQTRRSRRSPFVLKINKYQRMLQITFDLMNHAAPSPSN
jgi:hypothetical protein